MCLIVFAYRQHPRYPLIVAANRDEFHARPARAARFWPEHPTLLAGRDLSAGGTWLGITTQGRFAALTNYRAPQDMRRHAPRSRGELTCNFLLGQATARDYIARLEPQVDHYGGFNLVLGDAHGLYYYSNRQRRLRPLPPGLYGLSNHLLDTPWPKVRHAKEALGAALQQPQLALDTLLELLRDSRLASDHELPDTGIGLERERQLAPCFIRGSEYGTRASTALLLHDDGQVEFAEQSYGPEGRPLARQDYQFFLKGV